MGAVVVGGAVEVVVLDVVLVVAVITLSELTGSTAFLLSCAVLSHAVAPARATRAPTTKIARRIARSRL